MVQCQSSMHHTKKQCLQIFLQITQNKIMIFLNLFLQRNLSKQKCSLFPLHKKNSKFNASHKNQFLQKFFKLPKTKILYFLNLFLRLKSLKTISPKISSNCPKQNRVFSQFISSTKSLKTKPKFLFTKNSHLNLNFFLELTS